MLNTCTGGRQHPHEELVHVGPFCPACEALEENERVEERLRNANITMQQLDTTIEDLKGQLRREAAMDANR